MTLALLFMFDPLLALGLRNQTVGCLVGDSLIKKSGYMEWERERLSSFARALL